jgi:hypothetical protein
MRIPLVVPVVVLVLGPLTMAAGPAPSVRSCGAPGKPPCPLQAWMREQVAAPLAKRDRERLAAGLERLRALNPEPDGWKHWDRIASDGARAAREGNDGGTLEACRRCHDVYRSRYNDRFRERALP